MARDFNFPNLAGLANERLAWHFHRLGKVATARPYWEEARECYRALKAHALVERLHDMLEDHAASGPSDGCCATSTPSMTFTRFFNLHDRQTPSVEMNLSFVYKTA